MQPQRFSTCLLAFLGCLLLSACGSAPPRPSAAPATASYTIPDGPATALGARFAGPARAHPGQSGLLLLDKGEEALLWRGVLVDQAERSIDIQTFIWTDDNVGTIAAERILRAADRGVRVRVLVDDFLLGTRQEYLVWLNAHPQVEIRIYNPLAEAGAPFLDKALAFLRDWALKHRRMHNKLLVVDNTVAITGGRNIADEYYDMHESYNFRDLDLLLAGAAVPELSASFDDYWNSAWSRPLEELVSTRPDPEARTAYYAELSAYARDPENLPQRYLRKIEEAARALDELPGRLIWADARVYVDPPGKNPELDSLTGFSPTGQALTEIAAGARREILAETPYVVPMPGTLDLFRELRERGVEIRILTNSHQSTDNLAAFAAYVRNRRRLLEMGVRLAELRRDPAMERELVERLPYMQEDRRLAVHAKTAVVDGRRVLIGSFNLDPRSTHLNTELLVLVDSPRFAAEVRRILERDRDPENAWQVTLDPEGGLRWDTQREGVPDSRPFEPDAGLGAMFQILPYLLLPPESIL